MPGARDREIDTNAEPLPAASEKPMSFSMATAMPPGSGALNIVLVGCTGRMGAMLLTAWQRAGYEAAGVECLPGVPFDPAPFSDAHVIVLAVPVSALCPVISRIAPHLLPEQLLMDITSVKTLPMLIMQEFHAGPVIGTHPLFGPAPRKDDLRTALVAGHHVEERHRHTAEALFACLGSSCFWSDAREHDHGVALAQSLNFAMSAAFFSTIARHPECFPFLTPSFKRHREAARKHLTEDRKMFCEFTAHNPCFADALQAYGDALGESLNNMEGLSEEAAAWFGNGLEARLCQGAAKTPVQECDVS